MWRCPLPLLLKQIKKVYSVWLYTFNIDISNLKLSKSWDELSADTSKAQGEERLLFAVNKWLIAHEESGLDKSGAWVGLKGKNLSL